MNAALEAKLLDLLKVAKKHGLVEMLWKEGNMKIAFRCGAVPVPAPAAVTPASADAASETVPAADEKTFVRAPMVGTFRRSVSKGRPPLVMVGNHIKPGDPVGVVECMKIPTDVVSYCAGEIGEILVEDGQPVEYGQPLFSINEVKNGGAV